MIKLKRVGAVSEYTGIASLVTLTLYPIVTEFVDPTIGMGIASFALMFIFSFFGTVPYLFFYQGGETKLNFKEIVTYTFLTFITSLGMIYGLGLGLDNLANAFIS